MAKAPYKVLAGTLALLASMAVPVSGRTEGIEPYRNVPRKTLVSPNDVKAEA